jgi:hypothetical protein
MVVMRRQHSYRHATHTLAGGVGACDGARRVGRLSRNHMPLPTHRHRFVVCLLFVVVVVVAVVVVVVAVVVVVVDV